RPPRGRACRRSAWSCSGRRAASTPSTRAVADRARQRPANPRSGGDSHVVPSPRPGRGLGRHDHRPRPAPARPRQRDPRLGGALMAGEEATRQESVEQRTEAAAPAPPRTTGGTIAGLVVLVALAAVVRLLDQTLPEATEDTAIGGVVSVIEYPVYAILLGLLGNLVLTRLGLRERLSGAFRTEFVIKTGLVLLGASINLATIVSAAGPAIVQAVVLISIVFGFTWWLGGRLGLDDKLRALLSTAVSICGVSAAIAAAGAVQAKREQLAYTASLVIVFALPSIFLLPLLASGLGLEQA